MSRNNQSIGWRPAEPIYPTPPPRNRRVRHWMARALQIISIFIGVAVGVLVFRSPTFAISQVEVSGNHRLSQAAILERLSLRGENLLALPVEDLQRQLQTDPWVRSADIQRRLPDKVHVLVEERVPAVVWQREKQLFLVDRDGTVLEESRSGAKLPVIRSLDGWTPQPGERVDAAMVALALTLVERLPNDIGQQARSFEYVSNGGLVVETDKGKRARFGDASDLDWKIAVWKTLLVEGEARRLNVGHVDLRFGDRPFFRP